MTSFPQNEGLEPKKAMPMNFGIAFFLMDCRHFLSE